MLNPIIEQGARFRDDTGKIFEVIEIIGDSVLINHEIHGENVVLAHFVNQGLQDGDVEPIEER